MRAANAAAYRVMRDLYLARRFLLCLWLTVMAVSYTHLDVYKRQLLPESRPGLGALRDDQGARGGR